MQSFKKVSVLGRGAFGTVYKVTDSDGNHFALKKYNEVDYTAFREYHTAQMVKGDELASHHDYYLEAPNFIGGSGECDTEKTVFIKQKLYEPVDWNVFKGPLTDYTIKNMFRLGLDHFPSKILECNKTKNKIG